jgi:HD-GYP domain-containing protein (c-di-GMP phosphodiesterase class II)
MKLITVEDLREGDVLANDVLLDDYTVVLTKGTVIKEQYIEKLRELEVFTVYIEEKETETTEKPGENNTKEPEPTPTPTPAPKAEAPKVEKPKVEEPKAQPKPKKSKATRVPIEQVTILRDDVKEQVTGKVKDILELHMNQHTEGLEQISGAAKNIISDILEEDAVVERVYDVKERSADIYEHSIQVSTLATLIALKMGLSTKDVYDISVASIIHDLGLRYLKVKYENQDINLLPPKDREEYRKHTIYGYTAVKDETWLSDTAKEIVLNHHERKDGSGYLRGMKDISKMTQIIAVCDEFDELICGVGKARVRVHEAINTVRNYSGTWFDSDIVETFLQLIAVYPVGSKVITNKGEKAIVMKQNKHFPERPVLRILEDEHGQAIRTEKLVDLIKETTVVIQEVIK